MVDKGSIVRVEFDALTEEGELFDTTSKDTAKQHDAARDDITYGPMPLVVGGGRVLAGFDRALLEAPVGEEREVVVPSSEGFGEKDPAKVETMPLQAFRKRDITPYPGMRVQLENRTGTVQSVTPGRVRVDFNHPFAGKSIKYVFKVVEHVEDPVEKVKALIDMDYGHGRSEGFDVKVEGEEAVLGLPDSCKYDQRWFIAKYRLVSDLRAYAGMKTVRFVESYTESAPVAEEPGHEGHGHGPGEHRGEEPASRELVEEEML